MVFLFASAFVVLMPLIAIVSSSFKDESELFDYPFHLIPRHFVLYNFSRLADKFPRYILNSAKVTSIIVLIQVATASTGAYAFAKLKWKGQNKLFLLYISSMMIPGQAITIPQFLIVRGLHLYDTHMALILLGSFTAFGIFLIKQYFMSIPETYSEAAKIDGTSELQIFLQIILPMSKSVLITQVIFSFRHFWNDLFTPLIYLTTPSLKTLPLGMTDFVGEQFVFWGPQMAAALISILPVLVVFLFGQKYFIQGIASSGIKG
jgi:multiple sugar transport system permease protein